MSSRLPGASHSIEWLLRKEMKRGMNTQRQGMRLSRTIAYLLAVMVSQRPNSTPPMPVLTDTD